MLDVPSMEGLGAALGQNVPCPTLCAFDPKDERRPVLMCRSVPEQQGHEQAMSSGAFFHVPRRPAARQLAGRAAHASVCTCPRSRTRLARAVPGRQTALVRWPPADGQPAPAHACAPKSTLLRLLRTEQCKALPHYNPHSLQQFRKRDVLRFQSATCTLCVAADPCVCGA